MAVKDVTSDSLGSGVTFYEWLNITEADTGKPIEMPAGADKTVTIDGDFGTSGDGQLQGSNDKSNWYPLTDPDGSNISLTVAGMKLIRENPRYIRPAVVNGSNVDLNFRLTVKRVH